jgi:hypothetical protein
MALVGVFQIWYVFDAFTSEVRTCSSIVVVGLALQTDRSTPFTSPSTIGCHFVDDGHHSRRLRLHACVWRFSLVSVVHTTPGPAIDRSATYSLICAAHPHEARFFLLLPRVPFTYSLQARYLVTHPVDHTFFMVVVILLTKYFGTFRLCRSVYWQGLVSPMSFSCSFLVGQDSAFSEVRMGRRTSSSVTPIIPLLPVACISTARSQLQVLSRTTQFYLVPRSYDSPEVHSNAHWKSLVG